MAFRLTSLSVLVIGACAQLLVGCTGEANIADDSDGGGLAGGAGQAGSGGQGGSGAQAGSGGGRVCTPGVDQTCNADSRITALEGHCNQDGTCACNTGYWTQYVSSVGKCGCPPTIPDSCDSDAVCSGLPTPCFGLLSCVNHKCVHSTEPQDGGAFVCTPGMDQTCNDNLSVSSLWGKCNQDGTCTCNSGFVINPSTGK
jgi:hypothetical protein